MEEGPEPQEWVERAAEEHQHGHEHAPAHHQPDMNTSAITAAVLAVLAAVGSLLSGHAANEAILAQSRATDQWAYYQSKSTKGHVYEASGEIVKALTDSLDRSQTEKTGPALEHFRAEVKRYDNEKSEIEREAKNLEAESRHELHRHHRYSLGIACFQVGIVLASVSILVRLRSLYLLSLVAGAAGIVLLVLGWAG